MLEWLFWIILIVAIVVLYNSVRIMMEYERAVVFRLGRFTREAGPGLILIIPIIETIRKVDLRIKTADVPRQEVITKDNIPVLANTVV
ncbi:MAG: SPFH domain-containing protein [Candidatus Micrarchaeota archaeon]